jgi:integrative and conjugative element protein (TIGR02256 family)
MRSMTTVWLDKRARTVMETEALKRRFLETGGSLFGWAHQSDIVIACASGPGRRAKHWPRSFQPHRPTVEAVMKAVYLASEGRYGYLGSWHTHPCGAALPSEIDTRTAHGMSEQEDLLLKEPLLLILSTRRHGSTAELGDLRAWKWGSRDRRLVGVEVECCELDEYFGPTPSELFTE